MITKRCQFVLLALKIMQIFTISKPSVLTLKNHWPVLNLLNSDLTDLWVGY